MLGRCEQGVSKPGWNISGRLDWTGLDEWSKLVESEDWRLEGGRMFLKKQTEG